MPYLSLMVTEENDAARELYTAAGFRDRAPHDDEGAMTGR